MAEGIFRKMMVERGMEERVLCQSAGLSAVEGAPVSENAVLVCREIGVDISDHTARRISGEELSVWDLYFPMSKTHGYILAQAGVPQTKIYIPKYIADPYGARPWRTTGPAGTSWSSSWRCSTTSYVTRLLVFDNTMPPPPPFPGGAAGPAPNVRQEARKLPKARLWRFFFWARQAETRPALEFCGLAVYNRLVVLLP